MTTKSIRISPPNSIVLVADPAGGDIPDERPSSLITSTSSCIAIGCKMEIDGETEIVLGPLRDVDPGEPSVFEGRLETPTRSLAVMIVPGTRILEVGVASASTHINVWANDLWEPDRIIIGFD